MQDVFRIRKTELILTIDEIMDITTKDKRQPEVYFLLLEYDILHRLMCKLYDCSLMGFEISCRLRREMKNDGLSRLDSSPHLIYYRALMELPEGQSAITGYTHVFAKVWGHKILVKDRWYIIPHEDSRMTCWSVEKAWHTPHADSSSKTCWHPNDPFDHVSGCVTDLKTGHHSPIISVSPPI